VTEDELNQVTLAMHGEFTRRGITYHDAFEIVCRLMIGLAMAMTDGDRARSIAEIRTLALGMVDALSDSRVQFKVREDAETTAQPARRGRKAVCH